MDDVPPLPPAGHSEWKNGISSQRVRSSDQEWGSTHTADGRDEHSHSLLAPRCYVRCLARKTQLRLIYSQKYIYDPIDTCDYIRLWIRSGCSRRDISHLSRVWHFVFLQPVNQNLRGHKLMFTMFTEVINQEGTFYTSQTSFCKQRSRPLLVSGQRECKFEALQH